eukprot:CAMPEP_0113420098 /NCGR_PEP_ID=MMETSP0013_2-20120614/27148_1 /TAXON_ID=2843 ORGANISM="Skeletonema costatum, Strain 1716" /NCGR_SAMPLE_ID=MMETSP0013_2 /ASSEMBLY_ACC=CAM_ASM_000158 /LENGTH=45 /DNA_ID=CAMNT_0000307557 /DNA_START=105 /DNA_END=239 /DNA_ORIENTATION=- /assembly_acc=CAM_ASM_000158
MNRLGQLKEADKKNRKGGGSNSGRMLQIRRAMTDPNYDTYDKLLA